LSQIKAELLLLDSVPRAVEDPIVVHIMNHWLRECRLTARLETTRDVVEVAICRWRRHKGSSAIGRAGKPIVH
jgi:hypothetical protein